MRHRQIRLALLVLSALWIMISPVAVAQEEESPPAVEADVPANPISKAELLAQVDAEKALPPSFDPRFVAEEEASLKVWNRDIVQLRAVVAGLEPHERKNQAIERIASLPEALLQEDVWSDPASIRGMDFILIGVKDQVLLGLKQEDLDPTSDQTLEELGSQVADRIQAVLEARSRQRHWPIILRGLGLSLVATLVFFLLMSGVIRLRARMARRLTEHLRKRQVRLSGFDLRPYLRNLVRGTVGMFSWFLIIPLAYLWLTFVLKRFPFTYPWGVGLGNFLIDLLTDLTLGALGAVPGLFTVFLIFLFTRFLTRIVGAFFLSVENEALEVHWLQPETAKATRRLIIVIMWIFALTVAYPYIPGSSSSAFRGVSVFVGLMVSLGATGLVNQIVSGMVIVYARAFRPGEYVRIGDTEGIVEEIGVLSTKVTTRRREHITIPNAVLINTSVNNYSRDAAENGAVISIAVTIGYDVPWRQVHALLKLAATRCASLRSGSEPRVLQNGLSDFYVEYTLVVTIDDPADRYIISSELNGLIQDAFNEHGVQIMSPHYLDKAKVPVVVPKDGWTPPPADPESS